MTCRSRGVGASRRVEAPGAPDDLSSSAPRPVRRRTFFDRPLRRDWLALLWIGLWLLGNIVATFTARSLYLFDVLASLAFLYLIVGIGGGSIRMFVRGYREGRAAGASPASGAVSTRPRYG